MHSLELFYRYTATRRKKLIASWSDYSHDINCSILSSTECTASTIPRTGLKRMELTLFLTLLFIIICTFVSIKMIIACSVHIYKWQRELLTKRCYRPMSTSSTLRIESAWRNYRRGTFAHEPIQMEWCLSSLLQQKVFCRSPHLSCHSKAMGWPESSFGSCHLTKKRKWNFWPTQYIATNFKAGSPIIYSSPVQAHFSHLLITYTWPNLLVLSSE